MIRAATKWLGMCAALAGCAGGIVGCNAVQSPVFATRPRLIAPAAMGFIRDGVTTRQQVLLALGEPDFWWDGQRVFAYQTATLGAYRLSFQYVYLLIAFDTAGRVEHHISLQRDSKHPIPLSGLENQLHATGGPT